MTTNNTAWHVLKFGGTSVSTRSNWDTIAEIVKRKRAKGINVFVVHSAVSTVSNRLEQLIQLLSQANMRLLLRSWSSFIKI